MDYLKSRCPICLTLFCCIQHKDAHIKKEHPEAQQTLSRQCLLKSFQRKAERIILKSQNYKASATKFGKTTEIECQSENTKPSLSRLPVKRLHSEINQQIISTSIVIKTEMRKVLIPAPRSKGKGPDYTSKTKSMSKAVIIKPSPSDINRTIVKTSTPIIRDQLVPKVPQDSWNISQTSSISNYQTPSNSVNQRPSMSVYETPLNPENFKKPFALKVSNDHVQIMTSTSSRGIMTKISKYDNESGSYVKSKFPTCRRVTFSFESNNSSPLESVQEIEICNIGNEDVFGPLEEMDNNPGNIKWSEDCIEKENQISKELNSIDLAQPESKSSSDLTNKVCTDSSPPNNTKNGFFDCVTKIFRSAVPVLSSWGGFPRDHGNRSKRSRSPDIKLMGVEEVRSPEPKRLCYPFDMRQNPIKARKPISDY